MEDERYLQQLIAYIHLNPVTARVVQDPAEHRFSGHRDVVGRRKAPLVDVEQVLAIFGDTVRTARAEYVRTLRGVIESTWKDEVPGCCGGGTSRTRQSSPNRRRRGSTTWG